MATCASPPGTSTPSAAAPTGWRPAWSAATSTSLALQETKCRDDQFPEMMFNALGYEVAHVGYSQWNGVAILSRVGIEDVASASPASRTGARTRPRPRPARSAPPAAACGSGACTCRTAARWPTRTTLQARLARRAADDGRRLAGRRPGGPGGARRRLEHRPAGRRRLGHERLRDTPRTSPSPSGPRSGRSSRPGTPTSSARTRRGRASTRTGTTCGCASPAARACGSTSSSAPPRSPPARPAR